VHSQRRVAQFLLLSILSAAWALDVSPIGAAASASGIGHGTYRAVDITPWYPEAWHWCCVNGKWVFPNTVSHPSRGYYSTSVRAAFQVADLNYAKIDVGIYELVERSPSDRRFPIFLSAALGTNVHFAAMWNLDLLPTQSPSRKQAERFMAYVKFKYSGHPSYFHWHDGRPVIWVYHHVPADCTTINNIVGAARDLGFYVAVRNLAPPNCEATPDATYAWAPTQRLTSTASTVTISPGYNPPGYWPYPGFLARNITEWTAAIRQMNAAPQPWHFITTYCSWDESTSIESAREWASRSGFGQYLDALHFN
jgi:hypothetical protein